MRRLSDSLAIVCDQGVGSHLPLFQDITVLQENKRCREKKKGWETTMNSTHVGVSGCQLMTWKGMTVNLHRMQCNLMDRALAWPVFFTGVAPEPLNVSPDLLDLCNLLQNPCVTFTFPFCRRIARLRIDIGSHGTVPLHAEGPCGRGGGLLPSTVSLWFTGFSFHLLNNLGEFYRCLACSSPFIYPPVDIWINSDNRIFA